MPPWGFNKLQCSKSIKKKIKTTCLKSDKIESKQNLVKVLVKKEEYVQEKKKILTKYKNYLKRILFIRTVSQRLDYIYAPIIRIWNHLNNFNCFCTRTNNSFLSYELSLHLILYYFNFSLTLLFFDFAFFFTVILLNLYKVVLIKKDNHILSYHLVTTIIQRICNINKRKWNK